MLHECILGSPTQDKAEKDHPPCLEKGCRRRSHSPLGREHPAAFVVLKNPLKECETLLEEIET